MTDKKEVLTVGELKEFLQGVPPETEITFGSSKYCRRPLIFNRFKKSGDKLLLIELIEIDKTLEPLSEIDARPTAKDFLKQLWEIPDNTKITFGAGLDAVPFEFRSITNLVGINLEQTQEPNWVVRDD